MKKIVITLSSLILALDVLGARAPLPTGIHGVASGIVPGDPTPTSPMPAAASGELPWPSGCRALESQLDPTGEWGHFGVAMPSKAAAAMAARETPNPAACRLIVASRKALKYDATRYADLFYQQLRQTEEIHHHLGIWTKARCICPLGKVDLYFGEPAAGKPELLDPMGINPAAEAALIYAFKTLLKANRSWLRHPTEDHERPMPKYSMVIIDLMDALSPKVHEEPL